MSARQHAVRAERLTEDIRQYADVVRGHDAVHPDRDVCGGVGGCALLRAECDAREEVRETLDRLARYGATVQVVAR